MMALRPWHNYEIFKKKKSFKGMTLWLYDYIFFSSFSQCLFYNNVSSQSSVVWSVLVWFLTLCLSHAFCSTHRRTTVEIIISFSTCDRWLGLFVTVESTLLPTVGSPGWRWDAVSSTAESVPYALLRRSIQDEAPFNTDGKNREFPPLLPFLNWFLNLSLVVAA